MKGSLAILLFLSLAVQSCQGQNTIENKDPDTIIINPNLYISQHGQLELNQLNDSVWQTIFTNNEGFVFDTTMVMAEANKSQSLFDIEGQDFFLKYHWGGLSVLTDRIYVLELSSLGMLGMQTQMWGMYEDPFFKASATTKLKGTLTGSKGLYSIDGVYLLNTDLAKDHYYELEGRVEKEKWPSAYYSTNDSPQGTLGDDTNKVHWRLVMKSAKNVTPKPFTYVGSAINISTGEAAIAWEFADSEAYILDGHLPWTTEEEHQKITVSGVLVQDRAGSVIKNWTILN